jgi:O-succinylbenzoate synthase
MIVRVLQTGDSKSRGEIVHLPGVGPCQICDDAKLTSTTQLTTWLAAAKGAAAGLLLAPRLGFVNQTPDTHVYLALDMNGKVAAQITST